MGMSDQSIEFLVDLNNKLSTEVARLEAEVASRDRRIELLRVAVEFLAESLAEMHGVMFKLLCALDNQDLNPAQQTLIAAAWQRLRTSQNAFLKEFGDMNEPGEN